MNIESCGVLPTVTRDPEDAQLQLEECGAVVFEPIDCTEEGTRAFGGEPSRAGCITWPTRPLRHSW